MPIGSLSAVYHNSATDALVREVGGGVLPAAPPLALSVRDYGATGDGVTDDAPAIQAAINASAPGGEVRFPPGTYLVGATLQLLAARTYRGYSGLHAMGSIRQKAGANLDAVLAASEWFTNQTFVGEPIRVADLYVDGNKAAQTGGLGHGIVAQNFNPEIDRCWTVDTRGAGILVAAVNRAGAPMAASNVVEPRVTRNKVQNSGGIGIWGQDTAGKLTDGFCLDNIVSNAGLASIQIDRSAGWQIARNHVYGGALDGIICNVAWQTYVLNNYVDTYGAVDPGGGTVYVNGIQVQCIAGRQSVVSGNIINSGGTPHLSYQNLNIVGSVSVGDANVQVFGNQLLGTGIAAELGALYSTSGGHTLYISEFGNVVSGFLTSKVEFVSGNCSFVELYTRGPVRSNHHLVSTSYFVPTAAAGAAAGASPPAPVVAADSTDVRGQATFGTGTAPAAGAQCTVTFGQGFNAAPYVTVTPINAATAALQPYVSARTAAGFTVATLLPAGGQANTAYGFAYHAVG